MMQQPKQAHMDFASGTGSFPIPLKADGSSARLVSLFGTRMPAGGVAVRYIFDTGTPAYHFVERPVQASLPSITSVVPAAAWYERELHDQYGVVPEGHPRLQPLLFHDSWPEQIRSLGSDAGKVSRGSRQYQFLEAQGQGVSEVAVGPVHAGIIEPGHFRFSVMGDTVLHLELRHFYTHKGTEKLFEGTPPDAGVMIAESVSGDNCFAHAVAYCQAVEQAAQLQVPARAQAIRLLGLELERLLAHIGDVGALANDVAFIVGAALAAQIRESLLQASARALGTRYWRAVCTPGGVKLDLGPARWAELGKAIEQGARDFASLAQVIMETPSVQSRFESAGVLNPDVARDLAVVGPVARASGVLLDVRRDHPYGAYRDLALQVPTIHYGDVLARARIRIEEAAISARLIANTLAAMPSGAVRVPVSFDGQSLSQGYSAVESPRGELLYWLEITDGALRRCHIKSPSFQNWPAMPFAVADEIIADFPLINKSFNLSYSGCDR